MIETLVVGAGVVDLAVARALALEDHEVIVVDRAAGIGTKTSSQNSEVIHAGIYNPPGTLKAKFCVEGRELLYRFCNERGIPARRLGRLIFAVNETEIGKLCPSSDNLRLMTA